MCKRLSARWISLLSVLGLSEATMAADFPSQLWGKSVTVTWNSVNDQASSTVSDTELCVYVSSAGRNSSRIIARDSRSALADRTSLDNTVSAQREIYFADGVLLADAKMQSGAIRIAIVFDPMYGKCTARISDFTNDGSGPVREKTATSCSIVTGNALVAR
jgi:hypothetical protein